MQQNSIILQNLTQEQLQELITSSVKKSLTELKDELHLLNDGNDLLTRDEACQFLKVDSSTLWAWNKQGRIKSYGIGARRYYKKSELLESLIQLKK